MEFRYRTERYKKQHHLHTLYRCLAVLAALLFAAGIVCFVWFFRVGISTGAMEPTFEEGGAVFADQLYKYVKTPRRTDVVVYKDADGAYCMRRVVGQPGEKISGKNGSLFVEGVLRLEESYTSGTLADFKEITVPEGYVFVLPDNRDYCENTGYGDCVPLSAVLGVVKIKLSPKLVFYD